MIARAVPLVVVLLYVLALGAPSRLMAQATPSDGSFRVSGVVLNERTHAPVPRCHLAADLEGSPQQRSRRSPPESASTAETDAQGRFSLDLASAGRWQLSGAAPGFRRQFYNEHDIYSSAVVLGPQTPSPALIFNLQPDSVVTGFVLDEAAEPVRNATVSLQTARPSNPDVLAGFGSRRRTATTDDRGYYELAGIPADVYRLSVQATPWYALAARPRGRGSSSTPASDAAFDVVYPVTWYPGVLDAEAAGEIDLRAGDSRKINFELLPVQAAHLRFAPLGSEAVENARRTPTFERMDSGQPVMAMPSSLAGAPGQLDFGGLTPGLYRVTLPGGDGKDTSMYLQIGAGATATLSSSNGLPTADITFQFEGEQSPPRVQVVLTDVHSGSVFQNLGGGPFGFRRRQVQHRPDGETGPPPDHSLQVPAGQYQVTLSGDRDLYLSGLSLKGVPLPGRIVTLPAGPVTLTLRVSRGRGQVTGRAVLAERAVEGAMVMLVPTTFGQTGSIDLLRMDQSNTDGSFDLFAVIPGQYILLAIDRGWDVNWHDPRTLQRYLLHGVPLTVEPRASVKQEVVAQSR